VRILDWLTRRRRDLDLDEKDFEAEIRAHLTIATEERVADGADRADAHYAALREFGNVTRTTEEARRVWTPEWLERLRNLLSDVRYAVRSLARNPIFSLTVIAVLTLGIGLNAAVFTMLKALALSPVAGVRGSSNIAVVYGETNAGRPLRLSYPDYRYLRDHDQAFAGLFGSAVANVGLGRGRNSRVIWTELVTGNYFQILGVRAITGRTLLPNDEIAPGRHPIVVISEGLWRRDFGSDPDIVGKNIEINSRTFTIVGVADPTFHGTTVVYDVEAYLPVMMAPELGFTFGSRETTAAGIFSDRRATFFYPQGYLRPGITPESAVAQTNALWTATAGERPRADAPAQLRIVPFRQTPNGAPTYILPTLIVLSAMGVLVLMIACANIAGLVLVRGVSRRGEIAMRLALGAGRRRILRLLFVENLVLAMPGAFLGVLLAANGIPVLVAYAEALAEPQRIFFNIEVDRFVIGFTALIACGSAVVFGFVPALQSSRVDLVAVINEDAAPRGAARGRMRAALVVAQVSVSFMLLVGAGLVTRTLEAAKNAYPGFDPGQVVSVALDLKQSGYEEARGRRFYRDLLASMRGDSTIEAATVATYEPMNVVLTRAQAVAIEGYEPRRDEDLTYLTNTAAPSYFRTLRIPVLAGREFEERDDESAAPVIIVNRTLAERFWGSAGAAIGKRMRVAEGEWRTIVGVAGDVKYLLINEPPRPYFYLPFLQSYRPDMIVHLRVKGSVEVAARQAREHVAALDPDLPIEFARPMAGRIQGATIFFRLAATMLTIFGIAGMVLAAMGTYGLVSYTVKQSTHEIGIRIALGASANSVVGQFLARGLRLGVIGAVIGIIGALAAGGLIRSVLFGVSATDVVSFARALIVVLAGVTLASVVPAWRAARTNPLSGLRHQ
jgi:predicted permease